MSATFATANVAAPLRPLAETAAQFRHECSNLDQLVEELFRDLERLREELERKGDEIEESRRRLAERGRQLADQRKEGSRLVGLLEQQEARVGEALGEIKSLREQLAREREEAQQREAARTAFLEQKLRAAEGDRDQLRQELQVVQATAAAGGGSEALAPLVAELSDLRRQLTETQTQLGDARGQLSEAIERANRPASADGSADPQTAERLAAIERERIELESELELVRTRATELQEIVNQQKREMTEQRSDVTTELRMLRELVQQRGGRSHHYEADDEAALVGAGVRNDPAGPPADPVVSSVMAQFARLQKDVALRRKKK
jgi:chromosome segregation ATPase